jgi:hypothetical protein
MAAAESLPRGRRSGAWLRGRAKVRRTPVLVGDLGRSVRLDRAESVADLLGRLTRRAPPGALELLDLAVDDAADGSASRERASGMDHVPGLAELADRTARLIEIACDDRLRDLGIELVALAD